MDGGLLATSHPVSQGFDVDPAAPFVGAGREALVDSLVADFERCRSTATPRWVSIEGAAGIGKTRIIHELFARLAAAQGARAYWPARLEARPNGSSTPRRKRVRPRWEGSPGAVPDWFWWGLRAISADGDPVAVVAHGVEQFADHEAPLDEAWRRRASVGHRVADALPGASLAAAEEGGVETLARMAGSAAAHLTEGAVDSVSGVGAAVRVVRAAARGRRRAADRQAKIDAGVPIPGGASSDPVDAAVGLVARLAFDATVPVIVFVEDLHEADEPLVDLLGALLRLERRAVLVLTTSWSGYLDTDERFAALTGTRCDERYAARVRRIVDDRATGPDAPEVLEPLASFELETIARHVVPGIVPAAASALVERYGRPLLLELVAGDPELGALYGADLSRLTRSAVAELPADLDTYLRRAFERLPLEARRQLQAAAASLPHRIDESATYPGLDWRADLVLPALDVVEGSVGVPRPWPDALDGWIDSSGWPVCRFREWSELEVIANPPLRAGVVEALRGELAVRMSAYFADVPPGADTDHHERLALALASAGSLDDSSTVRTAAEYRLYRLAQSPREHAEAVRLGELYLDHAEGVDARETWMVRHNLALVRVERGEAELGVERLRDVIAEQRRRLGPLHPDLLRALANLGSMLLSVGRPREAYPVLREALAGHKSVMGTASEETLHLRVRFASCLAQLGRIVQAHDAFAASIPAMIEVLGPQDRLVIAARADHLWVRQQREPPAALVGDYAMLLQDATEALGAAHQDTLSLRHNYASVLGASGCVDEARERLHELYTIRCEVLGPYHPHTLQSWNNVISFVAETGRLDQALAMAGDLLNAQRHLLDAEHPNVLATRLSIGVWTALAGRPLEAVVELHDVARAYAARLGPSDPSTLRAHGHVGCALIVAGHRESGLAVVSDTVERMRRVLEADHPYLAELVEWTEGEPRPSSVRERSRQPAFGAGGIAPCRWSSACPEDVS